MPENQSKYDRLINDAKQVSAVRGAVVHPCDESSLSGVVQAAANGLLIPVLVGPAQRIKSVAREHDLDIGAFELIDVGHSEAAAARAVQLIHEGKAELLMKGRLHTDELMRAVTASATGLRTARRISHVFIMDVPTYPETLFIADAAINIAPDLDAKRDIIQNTIDLFVHLGLGTPRVAILSAVETVTTKIPSTIEAAALCKMAERGQITGGVLDGPLAFDNAIDPEAAEIKGIRSAVAGRAQILIVPDLEAGNMLAKNLTFMLKADAAGLVLGARVPIVLTSRAELGADASCLLRCRRALCRCPSAHIESHADVTMMDTILVVNSGSSSLKFQVFEIAGPATLKRLVKGQLDGIGTQPRLRVKGSDDAILIDRTYAPEVVGDVSAAIGVASAWLKETQNLAPIAVGHRVVHGGPDYDRPVLVDDQVLANLARLTSLAPLHQPHNLAPIGTLLARVPKLPQVACFDTAFHRGHDPIVDHYAIPERFYARGIRRYGFHGLSYEYVAERLREVAPDAAKGRAIIAHLGSGASLCAVLEGRSIDSTLGFTALDGLPMGTRPGQLDPGVVLHLLSEEGMTVAEVQNSALPGVRSEGIVRQQQ